MLPMSVKILLGILSILFSFPGCSSQTILPPYIKGTNTSAIIVVPGYYGTRLVSHSDGRTIWISAREALFGNQALTLSVPGLELHDTVELHPSSILDTVPVIPLLYSVDVYGSLLDTLKLSHDGSATVIPFTYDWRKDLMEAVHNLHAMILQLRKEGTHDISLVAHSLGGLIVSYYLRYGIQEIDTAVETWEGAQTVSAVVMAGVPFRGVMNSFRNMNFGVTAKLNTALLTSEAYSSFPSSYYTLPILDMDRLLTPKGNALNNMIRNPEHWKQSGWGLLNKKATLPDMIIDRRAAYMSFWLRRSQRFLERLHSPPSTPSRQHPSLLYLYATGTPTLAKGIWNQQDTQGPDSLFFDNRKRPQALTIIDPKLLYTDGDETVTVDSAALPTAYIETFPTTVRNYEVGHTELVTDTYILQDINTFLQTH